MTDTAAMPHRILFRFLLLFCLPLAAQQGTPAGGAEECLIEGRVVNSATGQPIGRARVVLRSADGRELPGATSDTQGQFVLKNLKPGSYRVRAERNGFASAEYGARTPGRAGADVAVAAGQEARGIDVALVAYGAITGRVVDPEGEPAPHSDVYCFEYGRGSGRRALPLSATTTNDLGEFRISDLLPGRYAVAAILRTKGEPAGGEIFVPTYYSGTIDAGAATPVDVQPGIDARGIEIVPQRRPASAIQGRVRYSASPAGPGPTIMLLPLGGGFLNTRSGHVRDAAGSFEIAGVTPGSYVLTAFVAEDSRRQTGQVPVEVGPERIEGLEITLAPGVSFGGRVRVEGNTPMRLENTRVVLQPSVTAFNFVQAPIRSDGTFAFEGVAPDTYTLKLSGMPDEGYVKRIRFGDGEPEGGRINVTGAGAGTLEVVLAPASAVEGVVLDGQDKPASATVALVPEGQARNRTSWCKTAETGTGGRFTLRGVAPGDYRLIALAEGDAGEFCTGTGELPGGEKIAIQENAKQSVQVKLGTAR